MSWISLPKWNNVNTAIIYPYSTLPRPQLPPTVTMPRIEVEFSCHSVLPTNDQYASLPPPCFLDAMSSKISKTTTNTEHGELLPFKHRKPKREKEESMWKETRRRRTISVKFSSSKVPKPTQRSVQEEKKTEEDPQQTLEDDDEHSLKRRRRPTKIIQNDQQR